MFFNSIDFAIFLPIVFCTYWFLLNHSLRAQNFFIVIASYVFYGWWDWRFLFLILISTITDYFIGILLSKAISDKSRKGLLCASLFVNLGLLGFFKYFNFFIDSFTSAFTLLGHEMGGRTFDIILPVGISFYTFQTLSYSIDVYKKKIAPCRDLIAFSAFVCFFPQLVAGPIERAKNLLPQFLSHRAFSHAQAVEGFQQILWGLFKKVVIADNCAQYVNLVFKNPEKYSGSTLAVGLVYFSFQIYGDFSGYSDIAIGTSRLFGFKLKRNFAYPFFSRNVAEFWRRWHISLTTWFRDYLYIPLGGSRGNLITNTRNVFAIFLVSGLWHGANWTFIAWGAFHAVLFLPLLFMKKNRKNTNIVAEGNLLPGIRELLRIAVTFALVTLGWVFFRAENIGIAVSYLSGLFSPTILSKPFMGLNQTTLFILLFVVVEWLGRDQNYAIKGIQNFKAPLSRNLSYYALGMSLVLFSSNAEQAFIYFQF